MPYTGQSEDLKLELCFWTTWPIWLWDRLLTFSEPQYYFSVKSGKQYRQLDIIITPYKDSNSNNSYQVLKNLERRHYICVHRGSASISVLGLHHGPWTRLENYTDQDLFNPCPQSLKLTFRIAQQSQDLLETVHIPLTDPIFSGLSCISLWLGCPPSLPFSSRWTPSHPSRPTQTSPPPGSLLWLLQCSQTACSIVPPMYLVMQFPF